MVIKLLDEIEYKILYVGNYPYDAGNTVVIKNNNYYLLLGHLKKGSIAIKTDDYDNKK